MTEMEQKLPPDRKFRTAALLVTAAFALPLYELVRLSLKSELHSHVLLIPVVSWYVWRFLDSPHSHPTFTPPKGFSTGAMLAGVLGLVAVAVYFYLRIQLRLPVTEYLWAGVLGYLMMLLAVALRSFGWERLRGHKFALAFLVFFLPLPVAVTDSMSIALQHGSAEVSDWTLQLSGLPMLRDGMIFRLPGLTIQVAEECSGVRSTLVLFITSLIAGKMFLRSGWKRAVLAGLTLPLGLLRNALRITVLSWLSVNVDQDIINGPLHHQGGPIFFVISLLPLFGLLWYFKRSDSSKTTTGEKS
jgi:exosortase C (VPDSG-CTERM-specific)